MIPFPCGDGTVSYVALIRSSVSGYLLPQRVVRHQCLDDRCRRQSADGKSLHAGHKFTPADLAVNKEVV